MKLLSATARNYRVHGRITVSFHPARTLIGGGNETGKSTLIEAIHHAFFLRSTVTGAVRDRMQSQIHAGHPEVEVCFEAGGGEYHVRKQFRGPNGTTMLVQEGGRTWHGPDAEERLGELLGAAPVGGRGAEGRLRRQWGHLWVWQGESGLDPSEHAAAQRDELLRQLQRIGGGVALQSQRDGRLAAGFAEARARIFTDKGRPRTDSDLHQAGKELASAEEARRKAGARLETLHTAVQGFEEACAQIPILEEDRGRLHEEHRKVVEKIEKVKSLRRAEERQLDVLRRATERRESLQEAAKRIQENEQALEELRRLLEPKRRDESRLREALTDLRTHEDKAERDYRKACEAARGARSRRDLAGAWVGRFEKEERLSEFELRWKRVRKHQKKLDELRHELAKLPAIDREAWKVLQDKDLKREKAQAARDAIAAEVEVLAADRGVRVGGAVLREGERCTLVEASEIRFGKSLHLRIRPGGGDKLVRARRRVEELEQEIRQALDAQGLASVEEAARTVARRESLSVEADKAESALEELGAEQLAGDRDRAREDLEAAKADISRREASVSAAETPASKQTAAEWLERERAAVHETERGEERASADREAQQQKRKEGEKALERLLGKIQAEASQESEKKVQLRILLEDHGDAEHRSRALTEALQAEDKAKEVLAGTQGEIRALQPDLLDHDGKRLERACKENEEALREAERRRVANEVLLCLDGGEDPKAALELASARLETARVRLEGAERKARAMELLYELFQQQQRSLSERFSRPLAEKITDYLSCLFGPEARAVVSFEGNQFAGIELVRGRDAALRFDSLSGGAREQVAAAVRLAMAELLAADHDGGLPIVFDDAFAYSDPDRVHTLQRMLDRAAERGLQLIVLTCNPSDYAALGARQVILTAPGRAASPSAAVGRAALPRAAAGRQVDAGEVEAGEVEAGKADASEAAAEEEASGLARESVIAGPSPAAGDEDRFLRVLSSLGGHAGNRKLCRTLGWEDDRYTPVKERLAAQGRIRPGRGRGGSVSLAGPAVGEG